MILYSPPSGTLISTKSQFVEETSLIVGVKKVISKVMLSAAIATCNLLNQAPTPGDDASYRIDHTQIGSIVKGYLTSLPSSTVTVALNFISHSDHTSSLMADVATRLIKESKQLEREYAMVVEKEFWNLLL